MCCGCWVHFKVIPPPRCTSRCEGSSSQHSRITNFYLLYILRIRFPIYIPTSQSDIRVVIDPPAGIFLWTLSLSHSIRFLFFSLSLLYTFFYSTLVYYFTFPSYLRDFIFIIYRNWIWFDPLPITDPVVSPDRCSYNPLWWNLSVSHGTSSSIRIRPRQPSLFVSHSVLIDMIQDAAV